MRTLRTRALLALALLPLLAAAGCGEATPDPVATVTVEPTELTLPYPQLVTVETTWTPTAELGPGGERPFVFVHLLDREGEVMRTFDHEYPRRWTVGEAQSDKLVLYQSLLGPPLPAGDYRLTLGLYGGEGRWVLDPGEAVEEVGKREYAVAEVHVPEVSAAAVPKLDFSEGWLPIEQGQDRQILASRWLSTGGAIGVAAVPEAGALMLQLEVPEAMGGSGPVYAAGAEIQRLTVASTCDDHTREITGSGLTFVMVEVPAEAGCEIRLRPNYYFQSPGADMPRSVRLIQLVWGSGEEG